MATPYSAVEQQRTHRKKVTMVALGATQRSAASRPLRLSRKPKYLLFAKLSGGSSSDSGGSSNGSGNGDGGSGSTNSNLTAYATAMPSLSLLKSASASLQELVGMTQSASLQELWLLP